MSPTPRKDRRLAGVSPRAAPPQAPYSRTPRNTGSSTLREPWHLDEIAEREATLNSASSP
jgi:hypothetical protein